MMIYLTLQSFLFILPKHPNFKVLGTFPDPGGAIQHKMNKNSPINILFHSPVAEDVKNTRWRSRRDSNNRERKKEERKRSGVEASSHRPWNFMAVMGLLTPFMESSATSFNLLQPASSGEFISKHPCVCPVCHR